MVRDGKGRFVKGQSGNLGGRPKGLAERCRVATNDGKDIVDLMLEVLRGTVADSKVSDRVDAAQWFADRGWGKAVQQTDMNLNGGVTMEALIRLLDSQRQSGA